MTYLESSSKVWILEPTQRKMEESVWLTWLPLEEEEEER